MSYDLAPGTGSRPALATDITPGRTGVVAFDIAEQIVVEQAWGGTRYASEIAPIAVKQQGQDNIFAQSVRYWPTGVWTLRPIQEKFSLLQEQIPDAPFNYANADFVLAGQIVKIANTSLPYAIWNRPNLGGAIYTPGTLASNDHFQQIAIPAGSDWASAYLAVSPTDSPIHAFGGAGYEFAPPPAVPFGRVMLTEANAAADQPLYLRWRVPGTSLDSNDYLLSFNFGQYSIVARGDGMMQLWEYCRNSAGVYKWRLRKTWRYCDPNLVCGYTHSLLIFPHYKVNGNKVIVFSGNFTDATTTTSQVSGLHSQPPASVKDIVYEYDPYGRVGDMDESPNSVTAAAAVCLDHRIDKRIFWQVHNVQWLSSGFLTDQPTTVPSYSVPQNLTLNIAANKPTNTTLTGTIFNDNGDGTGSATPVTNSPYVNFNFATSDGKSTPILYAYSLLRNAVTQMITPGEFDMPYKEVSARIACGDVRSEQASAMINDPGGLAPRLATRGEFRSQIRFSYTPPNGDPVQNVVLFDGYALRPQQTIMGSFGSEASYPVPGWGYYACAFESMFRRLSMNSALSFVANENYAIDPTAPPSPFLPSGVSPAWKVTAMVADVLKKLGFLPREIAIADNEARLSVGIATPANEFLLRINPHIGDFLTTTVRNYLGGYLIWDGNYTALGGAWTIIYPPHLV